MNVFLFSNTIVFYVVDKNFFSNEMQVEWGRGFYEAVKCFIPVTLT